MGPGVGSLWSKSVEPAGVSGGKRLLVAGTTVWGDGNDDGGSGVEEETAGFGFRRLFDADRACRRASCLRINSAYTLPSKGKGNRERKYAQAT